MFLQAKSLTLKYPNANNYVFRNLSFKMAEPGFNALFGPSGVGKTSLAKIITGELNGYSGELTGDGMETFLYSYNLERLPGWSSVGNHLEKITLPAHRDRRDELIDVFGLAEIMGQRFSQLSLGQQNRINLLRYLLQDFHLLIMDESLANVDEMTREKIILRVKDLYPDTYFLYISHNVVEVSKLCKKIIVLGGSGKESPATTIQGCNLMTGQQIDRAELEQAMLEVMNASS